MRERRSSRSSRSSAPTGRWVKVRAHAAPVRDETGQIQSAVVAFEDVSEQKKDEESLRFLSEVGRQLAESIEYEKTLSQLARLTVPALADWFSVELSEGGAVRTLVVAHADPPASRSWPRSFAAGSRRASRGSGAGQKELIGPSEERCDQASLS